VLARRATAGRIDRPQQKNASAAESPPRNQISLANMGGRVTPSGDTTLPVSGKPKPFEVVSPNYSAHFASGLPLR